jgi:GxxExxY protein
MTINGPLRGEPRRREAAKKDAKENLMDMFRHRERPEKCADAETEDLAREVIGAAIEVHRIIGPGLPEGVYRRALSHELDLRGIRHQCEAPVPVVYKGKRVGKGRMDLLVGGKLVIELKTVKALNEVHRGQAIAYLTATHHQLALVINFNVAMLKDGIKRVIQTS